MIKSVTYYDGRDRYDGLRPGCKAIFGRLTYFEVTTNNDDGGKTDPTRFRVTVDGREAPSDLNDATAKPGRLRYWPWPDEADKAAQVKESTVTVEQLNDDGKPTSSKTFTVEVTGQPEPPPEPPATTKAAAKSAK